ncbi:MAG: InlB B-repeat-containing protein [Promethearchaeota archaeon]
MEANLIYNILLSNIVLVTASVKPDYEKNVGGDRKEVIFDAIDGESGTNILIGETNSMGAGATDAYLLKIDYFGDIIWNRTYGGVYDDRAYTIIKSDEGGYLVVGETTSFGALDADIYLIRTGSAGIEEWNTQIGGNGRDWAEAGVQTEDGYVLVGSTQLSPVHTFDIYVVRIFENGTKVWSRWFGGPNDDHGKKVLLCDDDEYLVLGSLSNPKTFLSDIYLLKLDEELTPSWNQTYGSKYNEEPSDIIKTYDGGYLIISTWTGEAEQSEILVTKLSSDFEQEWNKTYGTSLDEQGYAVVQSHDDNFFLLGGVFQPGKTGLDFQLIEIDQMGNVLFSGIYGSDIADYGVSIFETNYNDLILAGYSFPEYDAYVVRFRQCWLKVESDYGETYGESLYLVGENATFGVSPTTIETGDGEKIIFKEWSSDMETGYNGIKPTYILNMTQEVTQEVVWEKQYEIISSVEMGKGTIEGTGWHPEDTEVIVSAVADPEYTFIEWEGTEIDENNRYDRSLVITMDKPYKLLAHFQLHGTHYLEVTSEHGAVTGTGYYTEGESAFISVEPELIQLTSDERLAFNGWITEEGEGYDGLDNHARVVVYGDLKEVATWKRQFYLTVEGPSSGLEGWYDLGQPIQMPVVQEGTILRKTMVFRDEAGQKISDSIQLNRPITITSSWKTDYTLIYAAVGLIIVIGVGVLFYMRRET